MSVPKENIWQEIRAECLGAIPASSHVSPKSPITLTDWQSRGCYVVQSATSKRFELVASSTDLGSALITEVEFLLDNSVEHQVSLWKQINSPDWSSPAWMGVTFYYWSYYLVLALTRLTGRTAWFLTKDVVRQFQRLTPPATAASPGAGCFLCLAGAPVSATDRTLILEKSNSRVHDAIWRMWFKDCEDKLKRLATRTSDSDEERLFTAIVRSFHKLGGDWPSAVRNAINYRTGLAYTAARNERVLKSFRYLKNPGTYDMAEIMDRLESSVVNAGNHLAISHSPQKVLEVLVLITFVLHALATDLHRELIERHNLDRRWANGRRRFLRSNGLTGDNGDWPL